MQRKRFTPGTETATGIGLLLAGIGAQVAGLHGLFAVALAPFGVGLILSDLAGQLMRRRRD